MLVRSARLSSYKLRPYGWRSYSEYFTRPQGLSLNRRDSDFVYSLASRVQGEFKPEEIARAVELLYEVAPLNGENDTGPNLHFLQLLRVIVSYTNWVVPKEENAKAGTSSLLVKRRDERSAAIFVFSDHERWTPLSSRFPKAQTSKHSGGFIFNELAKLKKGSPTYKDTEFSVIFNLSPDDTRPRAFNTRLFTPFLGVNVEKILTLLFSKFRDPSTELRPGSLKPFTKIPFFLHYLKKNGKIILQTHTHIGVGERIVLHTNPDLAVQNRDEFAAQQGVDVEEIQVLPVRLRSMVDVVNGEGSKIKGIKLIHGWNPKEFGTLSTTFDNMKVLTDALGETYDVSLEDSYKIVQDIIGATKGVDPYFAGGLGEPPLPAYKIKPKPSAWSRLMSFFGKKY